MRIEFRYLGTRSGKALVLAVHNRKYLFNLFEGFQRYCVEASVGLNKISSVFLCSEEAVPPFVGMYLTLRDMMRKSLDVVCNPELQRIIDSANSFADRKDLAIRCVETYSDELISVESIRGPGGLETSYLVDIQPIRGRFMVETIPKEIPRHLYSELTKRRTFEYNGTRYDGNDYMQDDVVVGLVAVVYSSGSHEHLLEKIRNRDVRFVFCFQEDAARFLSPAVNCIFFVLADNIFVEYTSLYAIQQTLNSIHSDFLLPAAASASKDSNPSLGNIQSCDSLTYDREARQFDLHAAEQQMHGSETRTSGDGTVLFLGTGCAVPSKYRNVSAILYESSANAIMLDCGEDSLFQIHRAYGNLDVLKKLSAIFISHSHADHVLGVVSVLRNIGHTVRLYAPAAIRAFVEQFGLQNYEFVQTGHAKKLERRFFDNHRRGETLDVEEYLETDSCGFDIAICGVEHCADSCGIRVRDGDVSLAYSGDCTPSVLFGLMSSGVDVLIHEATFASDQHERSIQTRHSTVDGALSLFKSSGARCLLLTHFSQRYPKGVVSDGTWIACADLFRYTLGLEYPTDRINEYYEELEME